MLWDWRWTSASVLLPVALGGCLSPPDLTWEGEHVRLGAEQPEAICGGTRESLDRRAGELKARFGTTHTIDYYWVPSGAEQFCSPIKGCIAGCTRGAEVFAEWVPHVHEIVHAASTDMPRAFEEGLAMHWGDAWPIYQPVRRERLAPLLRQEQRISGPYEYARVAHFMAYLSETYGWERLAQLNRALDEDASVDEVEQAFVKVFGVTLDGAMLNYESYPDCPGIVDVSLSCAAQPVSLGFDSHELMREIDCASADAIGPYDGMVFVEAVIELRPAVEGRRSLQVLGEGVEQGGEVIMRRCGACSESGVILLGSSGVVDEQELPAGRYVVQFYVPVEHTPTTLGLRIVG